MLGIIYGMHHSFSVELVRMGREFGTVVFKRISRYSSRLSGFF